MRYDKWQCGAYKSSKRTRRTQTKTSKSRLWFAQVRLRRLRRHCDDILRRLFLAVHKYKKCVTKISMVYICCIVRWQRSVYVHFYASTQCHCVLWSNSIDTVIWSFCVRLSASDRMQTQYKKSRTLSLARIRRTHFDTDCRRLNASCQSFGCRTSIQVSDYEFGVLFHIILHVIFDII